MYYEPLAILSFFGPVIALAIKAANLVRFKRTSDEDTKIRTRTLRKK